MADKDDRAFQITLQIQQFILQPRADQRIKRRKRFIHQQDRRFGHKGTRKADTLLHAARQFTDFAVRPIRKTDQRKLCIGALQPLFLGDVRQFQRKRHVVAHGAPRQQTELLEHHRHTFAPHPAQIIGRTFLHVCRPCPIVDLHIAAHHGVQPIHCT